MTKQEDDFLYPFETYQPEPIIHAIDDGAGTRMVVPKHGCLTWIEEKLVSKYLLGYVNDEQKGRETPMFWSEAELVSQLLQLRKGISPSNFKPLEEVLVIPSKDGKTKRPMGNFLVHAIYEFFMNERNGWKVSEDVAPSPEQAENTETPPSEKK